MTEISFEIGENGLTQQQLDWITSTITDKRHGIIDWVEVSNSFKIPTESVREKYYNSLQNTRLKSMYNTIITTKPDLSLPDNALTQAQFDWLNSLKDMYGRIPWKMVFPMFEDDNPNNFCSIDAIDHRFRSGKISNPQAPTIAELKRRRDAINLEIARAELPITTKKIPLHGKVLALWDHHWGFEADGSPMHINISGIWKFAKDFHPDLLLLCGDMFDATPFSHWLSNNPLRQKSLPLAKEMYDGFNSEVMDVAREAVGDNCFIYYILGNHERFVNDAISSVPNGKGFWDVELNVRHADAFLPYGGNQYVRVGKLFYMHGEYLNKYHAATTANNMMRAVRYSHTHQRQSFTNISALDVTDFHIAESVGCLCNRSPVYGHGRPNAWTHGFNYAIVNPDGTYYDFSPVLNADLSFRAEGKTYYPNS